MAIPKGDDEEKDAFIPMGFMLKCMEISGVLFTKEKRSTRRARFLSAYYTISVIIGFIPLTLNLVFNLDDFFNQAMESLHFILAGAHATAKHFNMLFRQDEFMELFDEIRALWEEAERKPYLREYARKKSKRCSTVVKFLYSTMPLTFVVSSVSMTIFKNTLLGKKDLPIQVWIPLDLDRHGMILCSILQYYIITTGFMAYLTNIFLMLTIFDHITLIMRLFIKELSMNRTWTRQERINVYITHSRIIKVIIKLRDLLAAQWLLETLLSAAQITLRGYMCLKTAKEHDVMFLYSFVVLTVIIWAISLTYVEGSEITILGESIHDAVYGLPWYNEDIQDRKELVFMLTATSKPLDLNYRSFVLFDRAQFLNIVRASFSYLTMLQVLDSS